MREDERSKNASNQRRVKSGENFYSKTKVFFLILLIHVRKLLFTLCERSRSKLGKYSKDSGELNYITFDEFFGQQK